LKFQSDKITEIRATNETITNDQREKIRVLESDAKIAAEEIAKLTNEYEKVYKASKSAQLENSKLKARIQKLKNKRFRIEDN
jgi:peptidoglycan hydrolase CwlO-like protein